MNNKNRPDSMEFIGYSTSIFDKYASAEDLRVKIISFNNYDAKADIGNKVFSYPENMYFDFIKANSMLQYDRMGNTLDEYGSTFQFDLSVNGTYKLFSAELDIAYKCNEKTSRSTRFSSSDYIQKLGVFQFRPLDYQDLYNNEKKYGVEFSPEFRSDLEGNLAPDQFMKRYGTHWIRQTILGGRSNLTYISEEYSTVTEKQLQSCSREAFNTLALSISSKQNTNWEKLNKHDKENTSHKFTAKGGNPELIFGDPAKWRDSIDDNPSVVSFGNSSEEVLVPLWQFLEDGPRKESLQKAYDLLCVKHHLCPKPLGEAKVYSHPYYSGLEFKFHLGKTPNLNETPIKSNNIDSITIPEGLVVTAWSHPNYDKVRFGPYRGPLKIPTVYGQNDWDSMKIDYTDDIEPFVEIFSYPNFDYSKMCTTLNAGEYPDLRSVNLQNWQNEIDSIKIPAGLKVTAWSHRDYSNTKYGPFNGPINIKKVDGQNDWDSMKIEKI